ncbi:MAG: hypothetical protein IT324_33915, partial [Anaerolineae bacterium]|nr:hypothetical protein [Anaerolineae bacterium]
AMISTTATRAYPERLSEMEFYDLWFDLPTLTDSIDPFNFKQRIAAYKLLIDSMNGRGIFGAQSEHNVFWGYVMQLHWQWRSGRLRYDHTPEGRIDPASWWCSCNYTLSIIPLIAAMQVGLVPSLEILPAYTGDMRKFASGGGKAGVFVIPPVYNEAVQVWQEFFRLVRDFEPGKDIEPIRFKLWKAHHVSLIAAGKLFDPLLEAYSQNERDFCIGWVRMVDFLTVAAWPTDLPFMLEFGNGVLPERVLTDTDVPGRVSDMNAGTNSNLKSIFGLVRQPQWRFDFNLYLWKRAMRTRQARAEAPAMLDATFNPSPKNVAERRRLMRYMIGF